MVELRFKYSKEEYIKAYRQYLISSKTISVRDISILILAIFCSVIFAITTKVNMWSVVLLVACCFAIITGFILYFITPIHVFNSNTKFFEEYYLAFSDKSIIFKTPTIHSELKWDTYKKIWDNKEFYYLIQHPKIYTIIPKRVFSSKDQVQKFEELVSSKLKEFKHM